MIKQCKNCGKEFYSKYPNSQHCAGCRKEYRSNRIKYMNEYLIKNKERIRIRSAKYRMENRDRIIKRRKEIFKERRMAVLLHYGGNPPRCACCGETEIKFLTIDHIAGNGVEHRKQIKDTSVARWIISNGFPDGFQILCYNCNCSKGFYGQCPHQDNKPTL